MGCRIPLNQPTPLKPPTIESVDVAIIVTATLAIVAILSTKLAQRFGLPALILFVGVGVLAGSSGPLGIVFEDYGLSLNIGLVALAIILFAGGLSTDRAMLNAVAIPAAALATVGTLLTMLAVGFFAYLLLPLDLLTSMLLGAVVSSTDAAAIFSGLRGKGLPLRLRATVETESGTNDPTAILLTMALASAINRGGGVNLLALAGGVLLQLALGALLGIAFGMALAWFINLVDLDSFGLYPLLALSGALLAYALTNVLHGNGFLAVYVVGLILGNTYLKQRLTISHFMDGAAWAAQLTMFILLGLLVFPDRLMPIIGAALLITFLTIFVARPLAVWVTLGLTRLLSGGRIRYSWRDQTLLSWAGLKGAVPIILSIVPLMERVPGAQMIFNVVFVIVIVGTLVQGSTIAQLARVLGLAVEERPKARLRLELGGDAPRGAGVVDVFIEADNPAVGKRLMDLEVSDDVVIAALLRGGKLIAPRGRTVFRAGDHVYLIGGSLWGEEEAPAFTLRQQSRPPSANDPDKNEG